MCYYDIMTFIVGNKNNSLISRSVEKCGESNRYILSPTNILIMWRII